MSTLDDVIRQWEEEDLADAADDLEGGANAMELAQPKTWAAHDLANAPTQGPQQQAPSPVVAFEEPDDEPTDDAEPPLPPAPPSVAEPSLAPKSKPVDGVDWKALQSRMRNAELRSMQSRAGDELRANAGEVGAYRTMPRGDEGRRLAAQPLTLAKEQQGMEARQAGIESTRSGTQAKAAMDNPNSLQSQKAREIFRASFPGMNLPASFDNWSANDVARFTRGAEGIRRSEEARADDDYRKSRNEMLDVRHGTERAQDLENRELNREVSKENAAATRELARAAQSRLPAGEAVALGGADAAVKAVDALSADWDSLASEIGSGVKQFVPGTDANVFLPALDTTTQVVGKYLEGGRMTDNDVPKYKRMMPQPSDTKRQKEAKIAALKRLIEGKRTEESKALKGAGYRVPESDAPKTVRVRRRDTGDTDEFSPEDAERLLQNPNFERVQ